MSGEADARREVVPFVIFSMARCGSTTLMRALNCYPDIRCMLELFTPANLGSTYSGVTNTDGLHCALHKIFQSHNGIKHIWHPDGWPFRDSPELNHRLLVSEGLRIILLNRKNNLRRVVSVELSKQTGIWGAFTDDEHQRVRTLIYEPLRIEKLEHELRVGAQGLASLAQVLHETDTCVLELWYEDLLGEEVSLAERAECLAEICSFLRGGDINEAEAAAPPLAADLLDPARGRLNTAETYRLIPNADDIKRLLGSDAFGWLFDEHNTGHRTAWRSPWGTRIETNT